MEEDFNIEEPLFPFFPEEIEEFNESVDRVEEETTEDVYREIQWDYDLSKPLILNGNFVIVEGLEAVKTWCWKALHTDRYKHLIYTWEYGLDMEQFMGEAFNSLTKVEIIREITEGLMQNEYVTNVDDFNISKEKKKVFVEFNINTKFGGIEDRKEVML